jgi:DNA-directed RNA polymerase specialized sigma24 family protein
MTNELSAGGGDAWAAVIRRAQTLDPSAFDALVDEYSPRLYGFLYRLTGRREDSEDLVQELFDSRHKRRELEIRGFEARIAELKQRHMQAAQMREQLINQELRERLDRPGPPPGKERAQGEAKKKAKRRRRQEGE